MRRLFGAIVMALVLVAPSFAKARTPAWVNGTDKKYPQEIFLTGVGIADSLDGARSAARAEIAKVFKAKVTQVSEESNSERSSGGSSTASIASETKTSVSTDEILQGVEVTDTWCNEKKKTYYALAVLNKTKMRADLAGQIAEKEESIQAQLAAADKTVSPIDKVRSLTAALKAWDAREELSARKRVIDPAPSMDVSGVSRADIERKRNEAMGRIVFVVDAPDGAASVKERITRMGFRVADAASAEVYPVTVKCAVSVAPVERGNPRWKFFSWNATATLADTAGTFGSIAQQGQSSHLYEETAKTKALYDATQALSSSIEEKITQYVFSSK